MNAALRNTRGQLSPGLLADGNGLQPIWSDSQHAWCARDLWVYHFAYGTQKIQPVFRLPRRSDSLIGRLKDALARSRLKRWLKPGADIDTLAELPGGDLIVLFDRVYWYSADKHQRFAQALASDIHPQLATPLRGGMAVHPHSGDVYYGEYLDDPRGTRVARVNVTARRVEVCWSFPRSEIKHVHAIHYDRFRNRLWICTGDQDHESAFYYTDDEFQTVHRFAGGDQSWRAIALLFDETGMEWGMDAGQDAPAEAINRIYRYDFTTGRRSELAVVGNPVYAACELDDGTAMMQTGFEPARRQSTPSEAALWHRGKDREWKKVFSLPYREQSGQGIGRYGMLLLPAGVSPKTQVLFSSANCAFWNRRLHSLDVGSTYE